jgi:hypothetical protein
MRRDSGCTQIIIALIGAVAMILAAVIGGPLIENWLDKNDNGSTGGNDGSSIQGGGIQVSASANPNVIGVGQMTEISVLALADDGSPLAAANVTIVSGGGIFQATGTTTVSGKTGNDGVFRTTWSCTSCAPEYVMEARVKKSNFTDGRREFSVFIQ